MVIAEMAVQYNGDFEDTEYARPVKSRKLLW